MSDFKSAYTDPELTDWLLTVCNGDPHRRIAPAGDFLKTVANAAFRADGSNYMILRPALIKLRDKYPGYRTPPESLIEQTKRWDG